MIATARTLLASTQRRRMLLALAACVALLLAGLTLLMLARNERAAAQQGLAGAQAALDDIEQRTAKLAPLLQNPQAVIRLYGQLQASGLIGEPDRPRWIAALRETLQGGPWLNARYLLGAGEDVAMPAAAQEWIDILGETAPVLRGQPLTLTLEGTHEGELLDVLSRLNHSNAATFELRDCELARRSDAFGMDATCTLRWLSLYPPVIEAPPGDQTAGAPLP